ncbi:MAG: FadR family transcriptional regulator [Deltaproteobacteria bacterium]|nr:FadR family transcriptional regulator [Deltaproteobacteria bacterium]MBW1930410.1 FadR family transcriptional regulator [Deltaproteobacteria bacterium]
MKLNPIYKSRLSEAAIEQIKELITHQKLEPGSKLPSERELVSQLKISRASVREALRALEIMGLIEVKPGKGTFVKGTTIDLMLPLPDWISLHRENLENHFEARMVLEPSAAELAALRATASDMIRMKEAMAEFDRNRLENNLIGMINADIKFHGSISAATGNKTIKLLMDTITRFLFEGWKATLRLHGRPEKTIVDHGDILKAITNRNQSEARAAMERHLRNAVENLRHAGFNKFLQRDPVS